MRAAASVLLEAPSGVVENADSDADFLGLRIARGLDVRGPINVQFAYAAGVLQVIEANPRASRTVPFVAKALGTPIAKANARVLAGATIAELRAEGMLPEQDGTILPIDAPVAVKEAVLPFARFPGTGDGRGTCAAKVVGSASRRTSTSAC